MKSSVRASQGKWARGTRLGVLLVGTLVAATVASALDEGDLNIRLPSMPGFGPGIFLNRSLDDATTKGKTGSLFPALATPLVVDPLFGSAKTTIPIELPPGRRGIQPRVEFEYNSEGGAGPYGHGWSLPLGMVSRATRDGVPFVAGADTYDDSKGFDLEYNGRSIRLDRTITGSCNGCVLWASNVEDVWLEAKYFASNNEWKIKNTDGVVYTYGAGSEARVGNDVRTATKTFRWLLSNVKDLNGNAIDYSYEYDTGTDQNAHTFAYPTLIQYGKVGSALSTHLFNVKFVYEVTGAPLRISLRGGYEERIGKRLDRLKVWVNAPGNAAHRTETNPNKEYDFQYAVGEAEASLLSSVSLVGQSEMPVSEFEYTQSTFEFGPDVELSFVGGTPSKGCNDAKTTDTAWDGFYALAAVCGGHDGLTAQRLSRRMSGFLDVNGDGLVDYLDGLKGFDRGGPQGGYPDSSTKLEVYYGRAGQDGTYFEKGGSQGLWSSHSKGSISDIYHLVQDLNGDGHPEVIGTNDEVSGQSTCSENYGTSSPANCQWDVRDPANGTSFTWGGVPTDLRGWVPETGEFRGGYFPLGTPTNILRAPSTSFQDVNGDGKPDLLNCCWTWDIGNKYDNWVPLGVGDNEGCKTEIGQHTQWNRDSPSCRLYLNNGTGFGAPNPYRMVEARQCHEFGAAGGWQAGDGAWSGERAPEDMPGGWTCLDAWASYSWNLLGGYYYTFPARETGSILRSDKSFLDLNGDSLPDVVRQASRLLLQSSQNERRSKWGRWDVWFGNGKGSQTGLPYAWSPQLVGPEIDEDMACLATDGEPTRCVIWQNEVRLDLASVGKSSTGDDSTASQAQLHTMSDLRDMNGDGLLDVVNVSNTPQSGRWNVFLNTGHSFSTTAVLFKTGSVPTYMAFKDEDNQHTPFPHLPLQWVHQISKGPTFDSDRSAAHTMSEIIDINGDGLSDFAYRSLENGKFYVRYAKGTKPNLLKSVSNGLGAVWQVEEYRVVNEYDDGVPFGVTTVAEVSVTSGLDGDGHDLRTYFSFEDGYYDSRDRAFRGFRTSVQSRSGDNQTVVRQFALPISPLPGGEALRTELKPNRKDTFDGAELLRSEVMVWQGENVGDGRVRVTLLSSSEQQADGTGTVDLTTLFNDYDDFGFVLDSITSGTSIETVRTITEYKDGCPGKPFRVEVRNAAAAPVSIRRFTYDGSGNCNLRISKGYLSAGSAPVSESTDRLVNLQELVYDAAVDPVAAAGGVPTKVIDARGNTVVVKYATAGVNHYGIYPAQLEGPIAGQITLASYELEHGQLLATTDPNGAASSYEYDALGRMTKAYRPGSDTLAFESHIYDAGEAGTPSSVEKRLREPSRTSEPVGYRREVDFYDGLGRALQTQVDAVVDGSEDVSVRNAVEFDLVGRVARQFVLSRSLQSNPTVYAPPSTIEGATEIQYDALDRAIDTINPDGSRRWTQFSGLPTGWRRVADENYAANADGLCDELLASCPGKMVEEYRDALGRLRISRLNEGNSRVRSTEYQYDVLNRKISELTSDHTGAAGNSLVSFKFDSLDRLVELTDPDSGVWQYGYDDAGNRIYENDPKLNNHLEFCFDARNRPLFTRSYSSDAYQGLACTTGSILSGYTYDAGPNGIGRRTGSSATSPADSSYSFQQSTTWDSRGRRTSETNTYILAGETSRTLTTNLEYNAADRLSAVTYPPGANGVRERVAYGFDGVGQVIQAASAEGVYVYDATYDRYGRARVTRYGGGSVDEKAYWDAPGERFRLRSTETFRAGESLERVEYIKYDPTGNLLETFDPAGQANYPTNSNVQNDWSYFYNGIGELILATHGNGGSSRLFEYSYDDFGNLDSGALNAGQTGAIDSITFLSNPNAAPHQVTFVKEAVGAPSTPVTYDGNGSLSMKPELGSSPSLGIGYDRLRRVQSVTVNGWEIEDSFYDADGERRIRRSDSATTFFDPWYSHQSGALTKQIRFGDSVIALSTAVAHAHVPGKAGRCSIKTTGAVSCRVSASKAISKPDRYGAGWKFVPSWGVDTKTLTTPISAIQWSPPVAVQSRSGLVRLRVDSREKYCLGGGISISISAGAYNETFPIAEIEEEEFYFRETLPLAPGDPVRVSIVSTAGCEKALRVRLDISYSGTFATTPTDSEVVFRHQDPRGSTRLLTSYTGAPLQYVRYGPYGQTNVYDAQGTWKPLSAARTDLLYTGQRVDSASELYYYGARFYDPTMARFLTHDPAREYLNPYAYVAWNPIGRNDPTGAIIDTLIDFASIAAGLHNIATWESRNASMFDRVLDVGGLGVDVVSAIVPGISSGAGLFRSAHYADEVGEAAGKLVARGADGGTGIGAARRVAGIETPYGLAVQSTSAAAIEARAAAEGGATLYRGGKLNRSAGPEGQFWSFENPMSPDFAAKQGIPPENAAFDFVETATLNPGSEFITRESPGYGPNGGGAMEVVINPGDVNLTGFYMP